MLNPQKLEEIAKALGKVDEKGVVEEELRSQILGQLSEQVNYQQLYSQALQDPELKRTRLELDAAMDNAKDAKDAVFELFQDLDGFSLDEYAPLSDTQGSMRDLVSFMQKALAFEGKAILTTSPTQFSIVNEGLEEAMFTTDRNEANCSPVLNLLGLDHPIVAELLTKYRRLNPEFLGFVSDQLDVGEMVSLWEVKAENSKGHSVHSVLKLALDVGGNRSPLLENRANNLFVSSSEKMHKEVEIQKLDEALERELNFRNVVESQHAYSAKLIGLICG